MTDELDFWLTRSTPQSLNRQRHFAGELIAYKEACCMEHLDILFRFHQDGTLALLIVPPGQNISRWQYSKRMCEVSVIPEFFLKDVCALCTLPRSYHSYMRIGPMPHKHCHCFPSFCFVHCVHCHSIAMPFNLYSLTHSERFWFKYTT